MKKTVVFILLILISGVTLSKPKSKFVKPWKVVEKNNERVVQFLVGGVWMQMDYPIGFVSACSYAQGYVLTNYFSMSDACFYIAMNDSSPLNDEHFTNEGGESSMRMKRVLAKNKEIAPIEYSGKDCRGRYWREFTSEWVSIGYTNVPEYLKEKFDKIIDSYKEAK